MNKRLFWIIVPLGLGSIVLLTLKDRGVTFIDPNSALWQRFSRDNFSKTYPSHPQVSDFITQNPALQESTRNAITKALQLGDYDYAFQQIKTLDDLSLQVEFLRQLTKAYLSVGELKPATTILNQAVELDQKNDTFDPVAWVPYWLMTRQEKPVRDFISNLQGNNHELAATYLSLAQSYYEVGNLKEAFDFLQLIPIDSIFVPDDYPDPRYELLHQMVEKALEKNNLDFAVIVANSFHKEDEKVKSLQKVADYYIEKGNDKQAQLILEQALNTTARISGIAVIVDPHTSWAESNASLLFNIAEKYQKIGDNKKALEVLEMARESIENFPTQYVFDLVVWNRSQGLQKLADYYLKFGQREKAIAVLDLAIKEAGKFSRNRDVRIKELLSITQTYLSLGDKQKADQLWQEAERRLSFLEPKSAELILETAKVGILLGYKQEALAMVAQTQSMPLQIDIAIFAKDEKLITQLVQKRLQDIQTLSTEEEKSLNLEQLAVSLVDYPELVNSIIEQIDSPSRQASIYIAIAVKATEHNKDKITEKMLTKALKFAHKIPSQEDQDHWYQEEVNQLIQGDEIEQLTFNQILENSTSKKLIIARKLANISQNIDLITQVLVQQIKIDIQSKDNSSASANFNRLTEQANFRDIIPIVLEIFQLSLDSNEDNFALLIAQKIPNPDSKIVCLRQVAQKYIINGEKAKAKPILAEALATAKTLEDEAKKQAIIQGINEQNYDLSD